MCLRDVCTVKTKFVKLTTFICMGNEMKQHILYMLLNKIININYVYNHVAYVQMTDY